MPALLLVLIFRAIEEACKALRKRRQMKPRPLCAGCVHAHVQYATNGRTAISCTFAGFVRPIAMDVIYCTDYRDRNVAPRVVRVGFVHEIGKAEPLAEVATAAGERLARVG